MKHRPFIDQPSRLDFSGLRGHAQASLDVPQTKLCDHQFFVTPYATIDFLVLDTVSLVDANHGSGRIAPTDLDPRGMRVAFIRDEAVILNLKLVIVTHESIGHLHDPSKAAAVLQHHESTHSIM